MALSLKRKEGLRKGLNRVSEKRLQDILKAAGHKELTAEQVHEVRKGIKSLRAILRLARAALSVEERKARNQALRLATLEELGKTLGDARDLSLLRGYLDKVKHERELPLAQQRSFHRLLTYIDERLRDLHERALKVAQRAYRPGKKRFLRSMEKRWLRWEEAYS